jgi:protein SCO1/2
MHNLVSLFKLRYLGLLVCFLASSVISHAEVTGPDALPKSLEGIGIDQLLNEQVPTGLPFVDETGKRVLLSDYLGKKPAILVLAYYECPKLCTLVLNGVGDALSKANLEMGKDYEVITVSINPKDDPKLAAAKKTSYVAHFGHGNGDGWHFLTGTQDSISKLAAAVGFHYRYDPKEEQFIHASGIMVLTPGGKLSHYFYGIVYPPRDVRLALVEASEGKIGTAGDKFLLFCCSIDLSTGKYTASIWRIVQVFLTTFTLTIATMIFILFRYEPPKAA